MPVDDSAYAEGRGCYSTARISGGRPAFLERHVRRLQRGVRALRLGRLDTRCVRHALRDLAECLQAGFPLYAAGAAAPASVAGHSAGDLQTPVSCGGVAVIPGDVIKADGDGVIVIPKALASEVGRDGVEQERYERFAKLRVAQGRAVPGIYPPNDAARAEYADWLEAGEPED